MSERVARQLLAAKATVHEAAVLRGPTKADRNFHLPTWRSAAFALVALCATAAANDTSTADVRRAMIEGVNPAALALWDVGNNAIDEEGASDPSQLDVDKLARLREAARSLEVYSRELAEADAILASGPDVVGGKVPDGVATREQIQAAIDADPAGFRALAKAMGEEAQAIVAAVDNQDRHAAAELVAGFDGACQSCHERYWYVN